MQKIGLNKAALDSLPVVNFTHTLNMSRVDIKNIFSKLFVSQDFLGIRPKLVAKVSTGYTYTPFDHINNSVILGLILEHVQQRYPWLKSKISNTCASHSGEVNIGEQRLNTAAFLVYTYCVHKDKAFKKIKALTRYVSNIQKQMFKEGIPATITLSIQGTPNVAAGGPVSLLDSLQMQSVSGNLVCFYLSLKFHILSLNYADTLDLSRFLTLFSRYEKSSINSAREQYSPINHFDFDFIFSPYEWVGDTFGSRVTSPEKLILFTYNTTLYPLENENQLHKALTSPETKENQDYIKTNNTFVVNSATVYLYIDELVQIFNTLLRTSSDATIDSFFLTSKDTTT